MVLEISFLLHFYLEIFHSIFKTVHLNLGYILESIWRSMTENTALGQFINASSMKFYFPSYKNII